MESDGLTKLQSAEDMAVERFGRVEGLALVTKNTQELAEFYAKMLDLPMDHPDVTITAMLLATTRYRTFALLQEMERQIQLRVLQGAQGETYAAVLFNAATTGAFKPVQREIDRLHIAGNGYMHQLKNIAAAVHVQKHRA